MLLPWYFSKYKIFWICTEQHLCYTRFFKYSEQCCRLFNLCVSACYIWIQFHKHQKSVNKTTCNYNSYYIRRINADFVFYRFCYRCIFCTATVFCSAIVKNRIFWWYERLWQLLPCRSNCLYFRFCNGCPHQRFKLHCKYIFKRTLVFVSIIAFIMFVLFVCADSYNAVKELLLNNIFLTVLNFISALLIPIIYLFVYRRKLYE